MPDAQEGTLARRLGLWADLLKGGRDRHKALARLKAVALRLRWQVRRRVLRRPVVAIALVEHLGDIVAAEPVARAVRRRHPHAYLVWVVRPAFRELVESHPEVDEAVPVGCLGEWLSLATRPPFDTVYDLQVPGRECIRCRMRVRDTGSHGIDMTNYYDHGNLLEVFSRCAGLPPINEGPRIYIPEAAGRRIDAWALPEGFVAVHCTSNQDVRDWSADKWQALVEALAAEGVPVVEVGLAPVVAPGTAGHTSLCGALSILETAEVLRRARLFVGIDSGPAHLANAVGTRGVLVMGQYRRYARYMPYSGGYCDGSRAEIVHGDGPAASVPVDRVLEAVRRGLGQMPSTAPTTAAETGAP